MSDVPLPKRSKVAKYEEIWNVIGERVPEAARDEKEKMFQEYNISTVGGLKELLKSTEFSMKFAFGLKNPLKDTSEIIQVLNTVKTSPFERFDGKFFGKDLAGLPTHEVNDNVQQMPQNWLKNVRNDLLPPILVLGSSGSGKTTFAASTLRTLYSNQRQFMAPDSDRYKGPQFFVYFRGDQIRDSKEAPEEAAYTAIKKLIQPEIEVNLDEVDKPGRIDGFLIVIIDEVGIRKDKEWVKTIANLNKITAHLQTKIKTVQLVLAGTGLDMITSSFNSNEGVKKIRMKEWKVNHLEWLVEKVPTGGQEDVVKEIITKTPIFRQLGTNGRAAYFLVQAVSKYVGYFEKTALIDHVVTEVAFDYINSNGMKNLSADERRNVARIVLRVLQNAKSDVVDFSLLETETEPEKVHSTVVKACFSLLETHVEGNNIAEGKQYAVSISPSVSILLTAMMGNIASLSASWAGFEVIVALTELQRLFTLSEIPIAPEMSLFRSRLAFPATVHNKLPDAGKTYTVKVPYTTADSILLNGTKAPYSDVISYKRLLQSKHSTDKKTYTTLNLRSELAKMGVLKPNLYKKDENIVQRFMTHQLMKQWAETEKSGDDKEYSRNNASSASKTSSVFLDSSVILDKGVTRLMYPMAQLQTEDKLDEISFTTYTYNSDGTFHKSSNEKTSWDKEAELDGDITVVFATNKTGFNLGSDPLMELDDNGEPCTTSSQNCDKAHPNCDISRQHLDNEGKVKNDGKAMNSIICKHLDDLVDTNVVKVRFLVCSH
mmetsp:Transcript_15888/g.17767  ORF Transcript_15888/g.17767 Transcript_15888/m.17767 type:complete len:770 (-) Transcript_15888:2007-4316(-)